MLILFAGYDKCGKDSAFATIQKIKFQGKMAGMGIMRIAHADYLKEICETVFGTNENMKSSGAEDYYRMCLTRTSEICKIATGNISYFTDYLIVRHKWHLLDPQMLYICTDGRYDYEIKRFEKFFEEKGKKELFYPVRIIRDLMPATTYAAKHHNFNDYRNFYATLYNNKTLEDFEINVQVLVKEILERGRN